MKVEQILTDLADKQEKTNKRFSGNIFTFDSILNRNTIYHKTDKGIRAVDILNRNTNSNICSSSYGNMYDMIKIELGRKYREVVESLVKLCNRVEKFKPSNPDKDAYREFYLSSTDETLLKMLGGCNRSYISKLIAKAKNIGLLVLTHNWSVKSVHGKGYVYMPMVADIVRDIADKGGRQEEAPAPAQEEADKPRKPLTGISIKSSGYGRLKATDGEILRGLYATYPYLSEYQRKAQELSARLNNPYTDIKFTPTINRGDKGYISGIGIRAYSLLCSTPHGEFRNDILKNELSFSNVYSYDVKSSIYRVSYLMTYGKWVDNSIDFYETMQSGAKHKLERESYKSLAMRLYFGGSKEQVYNNLTYNKDLTRYTEKELSEFRDSIFSSYEAMRANIGKVYGSEIFLYESCLYLDLLEALLDKGLKVAQVYDCFYSDCPNIEAICKELLPRLAIKFYNKVMGNNGNGNSGSAVEASDRKEDNSGSAVEASDRKEDNSGSAVDDLESILDSIFEEDIKVPADDTAGSVIESFLAEYYGKAG